MKYKSKSKASKTKKTSTGKLTKSQQEMLKTHSVHHTAAHMREMRKLMRQGLSFNRAHNIAMGKIGK